MAKKKWPKSTYMGAKKGEGRYAVEAGRLITRDGEPFISINRTGSTPPTEADEVTHVIALLLNQVDG